MALRGSSRVLWRCMHQQQLQMKHAAAALPFAAADCLPGLTTTTTGLLTSTTAGSRQFSTSFWDVPTARQELYLELHTIRTLLPNRSPFIPHFTPHGVMLMPNNSSGSLQAVAAAAAAAAAAGMHPAAGAVVAADAAAAALSDDADEDVHDEGVADEFEGMLADSVKRKRKLKMKRHKVKKRRKLTRHQQ